MSDPKSNSVHLSERDIKGYLNSELPDKEMHRIERHLLLCDLCAEAVEGYEAVPLMDIEFELKYLSIGNFFPLSNCSDAPKFSWKCWQWF